MTFHANSPFTNNIASQINIKFNEYKNVTLCMPCQSGKTSVICNLAIKHAFKGKSVYIINGINTVSLKNQMKNDILEAAKKYIEIDEYQKNTITASDISNRINIIWQQDMKNLDNIKSDSLIIHDESHTAQNKNNVVFKDFYSKHNLEGIFNGDYSELNKRNINILDVSATPYSQIISKYNKDIDTIVFSSGDKGYFGINDYYREGKIHFDSEAIDDSDNEHLSSQLKKYQNTKKYLLVRIHKKTLYDSIKRITDSLDMDLMAIDSATWTTKIEDLEKAPPKPTVVVFTGGLRMGKVVCKEHIGMCYDGSNAPNADTIVQGFPGRCCGYDTTNTNINIHISSKAETDIRLIADAWDTVNIEGFLTIKKANNVRGSGSSKVIGDVIEDKSGQCWIKNVPVKLRKAYTTPNNQINEIEIELLEQGITIPSLGSKKLGKRDLDSKTYVNAKLEYKLNKAVTSNTGYCHNISDCVTKNKTEDVKPITVLHSTTHNISYIIWFTKTNKVVKRKTSSIAITCNYH